MGRTHAQKLAARNARLRALPQSERLVKSALIKKKEHRVLDAAEKHALKMASEHGDILRLWELLRTCTAATTTAAEATAAVPHAATTVSANDTKHVDDDNNGDDEVAAGSVHKRDAFAHKYPIVDQLMQLIEPKFATLIRTPSVSRVVQSMIKYGSSAQLQSLLRCFANDFVTFATDAYAHFALCALVRHATHDIFRALLASVGEAVPQLVSHKFGVEVLHAVYSSRWCAAQERDVLLLGVFKDCAAVKRRWEGYPVLSDVLARSGKDAALQKRLLHRLFEVCDKLVSQKEAVGYTFVQRLVHDFLCHGRRDEVSELCDTVRPHAPSIAGTREGSVLASLVFALSEPRKRKTMLQSLRSTLGELATSKYGAPVLARIFDFMYDTQLLRKYVANDLAAHMADVVASPHGHQILMHLLTPTLSRKQRFLLPHWHAHNLYAVENDKWNRHTWLTEQHDVEEVEVCSKSAMTSHLAVLPMLVDAFVQHVRSRCENVVAGTDGERVEEARTPHTTLSRLGLYERLVAREIVYVTQTQPSYKAALQLSDDVVTLLQTVSAAQGGKRARDAEGGAAVADDDDGDDDVVDNKGAITPRGNDATRGTRKRPRADTAAAQRANVTLRKKSSSSTGRVRKAK